ncbi:TPA: hypothetical protein R4067_004643 [Klebsiella pneumoniae]|jgi:hypothetical protein|nr:MULTISPECIES: hypothetical protein [Enterobacteriaceae]AVO98387.1 hypothetical protein AM475_26885 [Klebsiella pneumoniae subsp. ozaenae]MCH5694778.1 hypothetical protein [Salmonella enterica]HBS2861172.1 hypothetical protein [Klebsiella variicola subsp. variicola]HDH1365395.1 hypothetical protein [Klebsiella quasipneumoniae subsp. similipneumoniae]APS98221.1 hypothetical protein WM93_26635 [Klebsiella pneumoniae]
MPLDEKDKFDIDLVQKMITRTDGFHNYANTKSTIIITFITAILAAIGTNAGSAVAYLEVKGCHDLAIIFKSLMLVSVVLLLSGYFFVGKTVIPYIKTTSKRNFYSFIDTVKQFDSEKEFEEVIKTMPVNEITSTMISLQYTLSQGLVEKYRLHRLAIFLILFAAIPLIINTLIIFFV